MKFILTSIKDIVTGKFTPQLSTYHNEAEAKRAWANTMRELERHNPQNVPYLDLQIFKVAEFDTTTGQVTTELKFIDAGANYVGGGNNGVQNDPITKE